VPACGSLLGLPCSTVTPVGATDWQWPHEGESRNDFNDVDDYHGLSQNDFMLNSSQTYAEVYPHYQLSVTVAFGAVPNTKLVTINVTTPDGEVITYNMVRSNY
ncbi:MAG: MSHA biogenesis protein MshD, partial [Shewanella sp.]